MTWGGSGPFLFDGAAVEVGFLPIEAVAGGGTVSVSVAASDDDGLEAVGIGYFPTNPANGAGNSVGVVANSNMRFLGISIPQGATITSATLTAYNQFAEVDGQAPTARWYGWLTDDSPQMDGVTDLPSTVTTTTAFEAFQTTGANAPYTQDHDVTSIVQEIIDQAGWVSGNALTLLALDNGSASSYADSFDSYDAPSGTPPLLVIVWTSSAPMSYTLTCQAGSFTLTGISTILRAGRNIIANAGSFTMTGNSAGLRKSFNLIAQSGAYTLTGNNAGLVAGRKLIAQSGAFTMTGNNSNLSFARRLVAQTGEFVLSGYSAVLTYTGVVISGAVDYITTFRRRRR